MDNKILACYILIIVLATYGRLIPSATATPVCLGNCNNHGVCIGTDVCQCDIAWFGLNCSLPATTVGHFGHQVGSNDLWIEWTPLPAQSAVHVRFTANTNNWFGVIFNVVCFVLGFSVFFVSHVVVCFCAGLRRK